MPTERFDEARMDDLGVFLTRELHQVEGEIREVEYADIVYDKILPVVSTLNPGNDTWSYKYKDRVGYFDFIADDADDLASSDIIRGEISGVIRTAGGKFSYTIDELAAAEQARANGEKISLDTDRAASMMEAYHEFCDRTALWGYAPANMPGMLNNSNVDRLVPSAWITTATDPDDDLAILNKGVEWIVAGTKQKEKPDTLLCPVEVFLALNNKRSGSQTDTTVLEYFLRNNKFIQNVEPINQLESDNSGGFLSADRMVFYTRSVRKLKFHLPKEITLLPPERRGFRYIVHGHARVAGVALEYPKSMLYMDRS